jgi:ribosomal protein S1
MKNAIADHKRGDTWNGMVVTIKKNGVPVDLTGYSAISRFKNNPTGTAIFEFKTSDDTLTIPNPTDGKIYYSKRKIEVQANRYVFDLQITNLDNVVKTVANGSWTITQDIS